jgi:uncharacterized membrane protein YeaQ/YmgE (transglycosylase-associated protein family)
LPVGFGVVGLLMNIVPAPFSASSGSPLGGWLGYLISGFVGASLLIWIVRAIRGRTA